jgi:hypothetical protein
MRKDGDSFWKCWRANIDSRDCSYEQVDGCLDCDVTAKTLASHFVDLYKHINSSRANALYTECIDTRQIYMPSIDTYLFKSKLARLKRGKASDLNGLSTEHLVYAHPILPCIIAKVF